MNNTPYAVFFDHFGPRYELHRAEKQCFATFDEALTVYREYHARPKRRGYEVALHNEDNYDVDCSDGLTVEERDIVWSV